jgi:hypothetical protein
MRDAAQTAGAQDDANTDRFLIEHRAVVVRSTVARGVAGETGWTHSYGTFMARTEIGGYPCRKVRLGDFGNSDADRTAACGFDRAERSRVSVEHGDWSSTVGVATVGEGGISDCRDRKWLPRH